jgi:hypothetical protein
MATKKATQISAATEKPKKANKPAKDEKQAKAEKGPDQTQAKAKGEAKEKKLSALDAAARLLAEAGEAMNCQEMIKAMAEKSYWASPGGLTPHATLYSAILRELKAKGAEARFKKAERGKFAATMTA